MKKKYEKFQNVAYSVDKKNLFLVTVQLPQRTPRSQRLLENRQKYYNGFYIYFFAIFASFAVNVYYLKLDLKPIKGKFDPWGELAAVLLMFYIMTHVGKICLVRL